MPIPETKTKQSNYFYYGDYAFERFFNNVNHAISEICDNTTFAELVDYEKAKSSVPKYAIDLYSKMLGYYETLNDKVKKEKEEEKKGVEENKRKLEQKIRSKETSDVIVKKQKEEKERQKEIERQNQEPLPLLSRETEIGDNDMFLRNLQNILIQYQNQIFDVEENEAEMKTLIDLEKERDESFYGDTTEKLIKNYGIEKIMTDIIKRRLYDIFPTPFIVFLRKCWMSGVRPTVDMFRANGFEEMLDNRELGIFILYNKQFNFVESWGEFAGVWFEEIEPYI